MSRVALFTSCAADLAMPGPVSATRQVLAAAGVTFEVPRTQTCCGQVALNSGYPDEATSLMRHWLDVFAPYDAVVSPSGSCTATVAHQFPRMLDEPWRTRANDLVARTHELTQFLVRRDLLSRLDLALDETVAWHDSCHMLRSLGERDTPRTALASVRGLRLHEVRDSEVCCGFGGTFATKFPELSCAMADRKLSEIAAAGVGTVVASDPGCLMHLGGRARAAGVPVRAVHVAELLAGALQPAHERSAR
jgi:L-lactate dehydrogenase complex protein LldE